jgi:hypothetical protein
MRILGMLRADKHSEAGAPPSKELIERMGTFVEEVTKAGVLVASDGLHPSEKGKRVKLAGGKFTVIDGPFTESKELVASYALFQVKTMDEAIHWTKRFLECWARANANCAHLRGGGLLRGSVHAQGARPRGRHAPADAQERREALIRNAGGPAYVSPPQLPGDGTISIAFARQACPDRSEMV